jgi:cysteine synthase
MDHSRRPESVRAIRKATARLLDTKVDVEQIDGCALALGNGTTFSGVGRAVQERHPEARLVGVEPAESPWFYVQKYGEGRLRERHGIDPHGHEHRLLGTGGWGVDFPNVDVDFIDDIHLAYEQEWRCMLERLHEAGHGVGYTSAACQWATERLSARAALSGSGARTFFGVFYDPIEKYG